MKRSTTITMALVSVRTSTVFKGRLNPKKAHRTIKCSRIGEVIGGILGGGFRDNLPSPTRLDSPSFVSPTRGSVDTGHQRFDQGFVDGKVNGFDGPGHVSGTRQPGDVAASNTGQTPEMAAYVENQRKAWQAARDAKIRDQLFSQPSPGRVNGQDVEPFSSRTLEENAKAAVKAKETALAPSNTTLLKTAAITTAISVPVTSIGMVVVGSANEALKPLINPVPAPVTQESIEEGRLVDHVQNATFLLVNTLSKLRGEQPVGPDLKWILQTREERLDSLEAMVGYVERELGKEARNRKIDFQPASTGPEKDDIKERVIDLESRMAALSALLRAISTTAAPKSSPTVLPIEHASQRLAAIQ
ncbi:hypothetical protein SO486_20975 [Pseudomonas salmasensis]|uniref:Uncharacterized protein n=1 Tax=Pseudomonas salmasensis TaxID=2745514 RepID=A0ABU5FJW5_9PSED|nr:hypothetical protein [Pseudomonas salmasensis]MDY4302446.1 hypothetical protein [Pseudomonas salmasensis]